MAISGAYTPYWSSSISFLETVTVFSKSRFTTVSLPSLSCSSARCPTHSWMPLSWFSQLCCVDEPLPMKLTAMSSTRRSFGVWRACAAFWASVNFVWNVLKRASRFAAVMFMCLAFPLMSESERPTSERRRS